MLSKPWAFYSLNIAGLTFMTLDLDHLRRWIGRTEETSDVATAAPLACLSATLDRDDPEPQTGDAVPPGGHWLYFLAPARQSDLDENGHAKKGGFLPPVPFERRMWAGGRMKFLKPLCVGDVISKRSEIVDVSLKDGKSGPLVFVLVRHDISGPDGVAIVEEHDIVYRGDAPGDQSSPPTKEPVSAQWQRVIDPDPVLLFRYSALIFNGHRIHFDRDYVTKQEGYPGLIVHGPLIATLLMDLIRRENNSARITRFDYRARAPIFDLGPFTIAGEAKGQGEASLWALDQQGRVAMTAEAGFS